MSPRVISSKEAFIVGMNISYCATYFDQVLFAAKLANLNTSSSKMHADKMIASIQNMGANFAKRLKEIDQVRGKANFEQIDIPSLPPEYYPWAQSTHESFLEFWPLDDPQGALFVIGHAIGALRNGLILINLSLDFQNNFAIDASTTLQKVPQRVQLSIEKWDRALKILLHLPQLDMQTTQATQMLQQLLSGLREHLNSSLNMLKQCSETPQISQNLVAFNHKLIQIFANIEPEFLHIFDAAPHPDLNS